MKTYILENGKLNEYRRINVISSEEHIKRAYIELLKVQDSKLRIKLNDELCALRWLLADLAGDGDIQKVQEACEEIALKERIRDKELVLLK